MSFRAYMRWDGWLGMVVGISLVAFGLAQGHQGAVDAAQSGAMLIAGTGVFMRVRHEVPLREPATWFTSPPLAAAGVERAACGRRRVLLTLLGATVTATAVMVGLSFATGFRLTYMDFGVWAVVIGAIKLGPASAAIAGVEARGGTTYRVAGRPLRGLVELTEQERIERTR